MTYILPEKQSLQAYAQVIRIHRANGFKALANAARALAAAYYPLSEVDAEVKRQDDMAVQHG